MRHRLPVGNGRLKAARFVGTHCHVISESRQTARPVFTRFPRVSFSPDIRSAPTLRRMLSISRAFRSWALAAFVLVAGALVMPRTVAAQSDTLTYSKSLIVGERLEYEVKFGPIKVGRASMEVLDIENVRGRPAWHTRFQVTGGTMFFRVNDVLESWIDVETFSSLRFRQQLSEGSRDRLYEYEIYPDRAVYVRKEKGGEQPSVSHPLDDGSFLYFIRTVPIELGATYEFQRYFMPDRNPVRLEVLGRDTVEVPAGPFDALVIRPVIKAKGIFSEDGRAQIWISNDSDHLLLQMSSHLKFGSLSLHLKSRKLQDSANGADSSHRAERRALNSGRPEP